MPFTQWRTGLEVVTSKIDPVGFWAFGLIVVVCIVIAIAIGRITDD